MLTNTFCHIQGIGLATEKKLWQAGIHHWDQYRYPAPVPLVNSNALTIEKTLKQSRESLVDDPSFFTGRLPASEHWRIFPHFRSQTAYLDIETTGLGIDSEITTIALFDGKTVKYYINGRNLEDFVHDIYSYQVLVSYNGKTFDIPVIERFFKIRLDQAQIDLRYVLARLGFKGGLKGCEKQLGLNRGILDGVDGYFAVLLWRQYERYNDEKALESLLAYNIEDTVNLERLLVEAYNRNVAANPFGDELFIDIPKPADIPFQADLDYIRKFKTQNAQYMI